MKKCTIACVIGLLSVCILKGQPVEIRQFHTKSFNVNEGLLQSHISDMAFDSLNFGWLSFENGIQRFDGQRFYEVPLQPGLPDDKGVSFFTTNDGSLLISHAKGITRYLPSSHSFKQEYFIPYNTIFPLRPVGEYNDATWWLTEKGMLIGLRNKTFEQVYNEALPFKKKPETFWMRRVAISNLLNGHVAFAIDSLMFVWNITARKVSATVSLEMNIPSVLPYLLSDHSFIIQTSYELPDIFYINSQTGKKQRVRYFTGDYTRAFRGGFFQMEGDVWAFGDNKVFKVDTSTHEIKEKIKSYFYEEAMGEAGLNKVRTDRLGNLYLLTVTNGFRKGFIRNYPFKYFGSGVTGNRFAVSVLPDKPANRILVGTQGNGLLVYDTIGQLLQHVQFETKNNATNSPSNIIRLEDGSYLVFIWGQNFVWHLSKDLQAKRVHSVLPANDSILNEYYTNSFQDYAKRSWVVSNKSSLVISPNGKSIRISPFKKLDFAASAIIGRQLLNVEDETLVFRNEATLSIERKIQLKNTGGVRCIYVDKRRNIFAGTNKGVFWLDESGTLKGHYSKKNGLPDECIYGVVADASGNIWASTNRGLMAILSDGSVLPLSKIHGLQENEFNTNVAAVADDGEIFFGGVNGVTGFYPERVLAYNDTVQLLLTNVLINGTPLGRDTSYWSMKSIELPYNENTIQLDFLAMGFYGPDNYNYQYRILERGNDWINIGTNRNAQFFLPPGRYRLQLFASSFFKADAEPLKELEIVIRNPFWKSSWFRTLIAFLLIGLVVVAFYLKFKRRYQAQQLQLKMEEQKRIERERISRDLHDSLGAYVNVVLYHIELLEDEKNLREVGPVLTNLKFASKDMINVLRDTVWALKKDSFTAQDCVIRIREFLHSCSKYYSSINFSFEGNVPEEKVLVYNKALNLLRIVEEGVTNSIKHSGCRNIVLRSLEDGMNWKIEIEDDGKGFDAHSEYDGNGLHNIKSRALESGFKINFDSKALSGTKISITL